MIVEWFVSLVGTIVGGLLDWVGNCVEAVNAVCPVPEIPELSPLFGMMGTLDYATGGVIGESFSVLGLMLCVMLMLFLFGLFRQIWRFVPVIGGG